MDDYAVKQILGAGTFGKVCLVKKKSSKQIFAIKMAAKKVDGYDMCDHLLAERNFLNILRSSSHVVSLYECFQDDANAYFVLEPCASNFDEVMQLRKFNLVESAFYLAELAVGIDAMHSKKIVHRDIKPQNILVSYEGHLKIGDLGLSLLMSRDQHQGSCGTWSYSSPEMLAQQPYGFSTDFWSCGVIAYQLFTNRHPLGNAASMEQCLNASRQIEFNKIQDVEARNFATGLLSDSKTRLNIAGIRQHKFMALMDFKTIESFAYKPPIVPARNNENFLEQFSVSPGIVKAFTSIGRRIKGFSFANFSNAPIIPDTTSQQLRANQGCQVDLADVPTNQTDQFVQTKVDAWLAGKRRFQGNVIVREGEIYCHVDNCRHEQPFQVTTGARFIGFMRHFDTKHSIEAQSGTKKLKRR